MKNHSGAESIRARELCALAVVTAAALTVGDGLHAVAGGSGPVDGGVSFVDIAAGDGAGIDYRRVRSPRDALFDQFKAQPVYTMADVPNTPIKPRGAPGVAILDYDGDGDDDIYVTNGPGAANSLYQNQLAQVGSVGFVDVGVAAGADATAQDSNGVCAGDIDNDGDPDLLVLGAGEPSVLYENDGAGGFVDITQAAGIGGGHHFSTTCSMGDVNGDGLLDVVVANSYTSWDEQQAIFLVPYLHNEFNQLFVNQGGNVFADASANSGLLDTSGFRPASDGEPTITWAIAMVDIDRDGDVDIVHADDQAAFPRFVEGGVDRGLVHVFENDGTGHFTNITAQVGTDVQGQWMGLSFADFDCDGSLDIFGANLGDYMFQLLPKPIPYALGDSASRWFLGAPGGGFSDPGVGALVSSVFGWGTGAVDYDNDGDPDILYHGGLDAGPFVEASNPGVVLRNQGCSAQFVYDPQASSATDHQRRNVQGVAIGDLDRDGFVDVVSVSNFDHPPPSPLAPWPTAWGSVFDTAAFVPTFIPTGPGTFVFSGLDHPDGTLSVELNTGDNGNRWIAVSATGTVGITTGGRANRGGIGAVVEVRPAHGYATARPITAGSSYASTHSRELGFGLGTAHKARIEVLWPGGTRNRLYAVPHATRVRFPEIPCSFDDDWDRFRDYKACVRGALDEIEAAGMITPLEKFWLGISAAIAYFDPT